MDADRLNSPNTSAVLFELLGHQLQFSQDPNSKHLGTTVWDASMVLAKFMEKNSRKGKYSPSKLKGKRVIELGAGCGLAGFSMAMLGCDVISTDQTEVLPLLMRNIERNTSRIQSLQDSDAFGSIQVAELDWGNVDHIRAVDPPFDYIIGTDIVYAEHLLEPLLQTLLLLSGPRTTLMLGYELRSTDVHDKMLNLWKRNFMVKIVPKAKMHSEYQHPSIQLFIMNPRPSDGTIKDTQYEFKTSKSEENKEESEENVDIDEDGDCNSPRTDEPTDNQVNLPGQELSDWETRRYGAMAARFLRDVKIT